MLVALLPMWHLLCLAALALGPFPAQAQQGSFVGRPGLAGPETPPATKATCQTLTTTLSGFMPPSTRVDLWVSGPVTLVQTDGALWYVAICPSPGIRVMCVTYSDNGLKLGNQVTLRGAMQIQDERHVLLDPCLASRD